MKKKIVGSIIAASLFAFSGCSLSGATHQSAQAAATDGSHAGISQMPSGFRNVAYKCVRVGGTFYAVFSVSDGGNGNDKPGSVAAVLDPTCKHFGP